MKLFIKEVEINNILGCNHVHLSFNQPNKFVNVVQSDPDCPIRDTFCTAIQLFFSAKYASIESLSKLKDIQNGSARIIFLLAKMEATDGGGSGDSDANAVHVEDSDDSDPDTPCTSAQARERQLRRLLKRQQVGSQMHMVEAIRDFRNNLEKIIFSIDNGAPSAYGPALFHNLFCTNVEYVLPNLKRLEEDFSGNWMHMLSNELNEMFNQKDCMQNPFHRFVDLYALNKYSTDHLLSKMTTSCVMSNITMNLLQKSLMLKVFVDTRKIFEFISCMEYTVWFLIPYEGEFIDMEDALNENLEFSTMQTLIQLRSELHKRPFVWTNADHAIKDLLLIAFQLSIAFHCKRRVVYFQKMDALKDHQSLELAIAANLQLLGETQINWTCKNYLQRIIDVCNKIYITAIIEYPGGLPLPPKDANVLKCYKTGENEDWQMKVVETPPCTVEFLVDCIDKSLKPV